MHSKSTVQAGRCGLMVRKTSLRWSSPSRPAAGTRSALVGLGPDWTGAPAPTARGGRRGPPFHPAGEYREPLLASPAPRRIDLVGEPFDAIIMNPFLFGMLICSQTGSPGRR